MLRNLAIYMSAALAASLALDAQAQPARLLTSVAASPALGRRTDLGRHARTEQCHAEQD
jgi:hypothetical protein